MNHATVVTGLILAVFFGGFGPESPKLPEHDLFHPLLHKVTGDFNGDGLSGDVAAFEEAGDGGYILVVHFAGTGESHVVSRLEHLFDMGLRRVPPGSFENTCLDSTYHSCAGMLVGIITAADSFSIFKAESFETLLVWHNGAFIDFPLAD